MKKILLFTLLLANFFYCNALTRISAYRWRNDDGTEASATWKAPVNKAIQINNLDPIRIRMEVNQPNSATTIALKMQFSIDGSSWTYFTDSSSPFNLVSSANVSNGTMTTQQIATDGAAGFVDGVFRSTENEDTFVLNTGVSEFEFSIQPNALISSSVTYTFRFIDSQFNTFPALSYCPTAIVAPVAVSPQSFNVNENAKISDLKATGTNLKWYKEQYRGTELNATAVLSTGLYYVSQTESCESLPTEVQVNVIDGTSLSFKGGYVKLPINMPKTYTKEAWIYGDALSGAHNIISGGPSVGEHALYVNAGVLSAGHNGTWNYVVDNVPLDIHTWYHVALTYDASGTMKLYKNGSIVATRTNVPTFTGSAVRIGSFEPGGNLFYGAIDEVRIWNKALSQAEIQENMNCELSTGQPGLVAYYKFNQGTEGADNTAINKLKDSSGNMNDGILTNFDLSADEDNWITGSTIQTGNSCTTLSIQDKNFDFTSSLKVYPNPSSDAFFMNSDSNGTIVISDLTGKIIQSQKINSGTTPLHLGNVANGVYLVRMTNENNESKTLKLIKK